MHCPWSSLVGGKFAIDEPARMTLASVASLLHPACVLCCTFTMGVLLSLVTLSLTGLPSALWRGSYVD